MASLARKSVRHELRRPLLAALSVLALGVMTAGPSQGADRPLPEPACAVWDADLLALIDEHGEAGGVPEARAESLSTLLEARIACGEGRLSDAIALYDSVQVSWLR